MRLTSVKSIRSLSYCFHSTRSPIEKIRPIFIFFQIFFSFLPNFDAANKQFVCLVISAIISFRHLPRQRQTFQCTNNFHCILQAKNCS